eukprot:scaffold20281_cov48-Phaeocystis_antarctica.AAC.2
MSTSAGKSKATRVRRRRPSLVVFQPSAHREHTAAAAPSSSGSGASKRGARSLESSTPSTNRCASGLFAARIASAWLVTSVSVLVSPCSLRSHHHAKRSTQAKKTSTSIQCSVGSCHRRASTGPADGPGGARDQEADVAEGGGGPHQRARRFRERFLRGARASLAQR